jgi:hypothetical protein
MSIILKILKSTRGVKMKKLAVFAISALLIATNATAAPAQKLDAKALAKTILNVHQFKGSEKGSFAIVYCGQDISRNTPGQPGRFGSPVLLG